MKNQNKIIMLSSLILGTLVLTLGITLAVFNYQGTTNNQQLVLGDIYMHYQEVNALKLENTLPGDEYSEYFEFKITGKNTYTKKDIYYDIKLTRGDLPDGKTEDNRISDNYLKFKLVEVNGDTETEIIKDKTYQELTNQVIHAEKIAKNTTSEVNKTYRLYMTISNDLIIGNTSDAMYTSEEWAMAFASVKVNVTGDFTVREVPLTGAETMQKAIANKAVSSPSCKTTVEEDGIIYISGTKTCIDFNYVWYSGKLWRITAIYPDGTMKMITDGLMTTIAYGDNNKFYTDENTTSYMYQWLNQEFLPTLYNYENIIVEDAGWYSITDSNSPPTKPTGDYTLTDPVGLLNAYEYYMSYKYTISSNGYLDNGYAWWLITPYSSSRVRNVGSNGKLYDNNPSSYSCGVRPSINLQSSIQLVGGSGTVDNPYRIKGDKENIEENVTLLNTRESGEYVKLSSDETAPTFRIVDTELVEENLTTKIVLNDYVKDTNDLDADSNTTEVLEKYFSSSNSYELWTEVDKNDTTYWRGYLNNTWIREIDNTYNETDGTSSILEKGTYYLGYHKSGSYKTTVCSTISSDISVRECIENGTVVTNTSSEDYVGLLRVGEMFASMFGTGYSSSSYMWLITPYSSSNVRSVSSSCHLVNLSPSSDSGRGARPSINLKSTLIIKSGSGTKQDPFVVGLSSSE